jgi:predicted nucleotidyltransferase
LNLPPDFRDLLVCLSDAHVEFMIVGGYAVAHHGHVRATKDIDVFVRPTRENAVKVVRALEAFGAPLAALNIGLDDFATPGRVIQLGVPPLRVDLLTAVTALDFEKASQTTGRLEVDGRSVAVIGLDALLENKRAAGRPQDLADADRLERLRTSKR